VLTKTLQTLDLSEEAKGVLFLGQRSLEQVCDIMRSRVSILLVRAGKEGDKLKIL
jgi:hypothetical protein